LLGRDELLLQLSAIVFDEVHVEQERVRFVFGVLLDAMFDVYNTTCLFNVLPHGV
jgi:hypothetical protein